MVAFDREGVQGDVGEGKGLFLNTNSYPEEMATSPSSDVSTPRGILVMSNSGKSLLVTNSSKSLVFSNSGKRFDHTGSGKRVYAKKVTGRHNDTELHLAARRGDLGAVRQILGEINNHMMGTLSGPDFDSQVAEIRSAVVNEANDLGETSLFTAAEKGHLDVVKELLPLTTKESISGKNHLGFDSLHIAASKGHKDVVQLLLDYDVGLCRTVGQSNATPLISAATMGHADVVNELLSKDSSLIGMSRSNGKNALHLASRQGHVDVVRALLGKDSKLARKTDKKGQTSLHMAVKGTSSEAVKLLLTADPTIVALSDKFGNTALQIASRKKRVEIVHVLLEIPGTDVNALTRDKRTALDIAEGLPLSEETAKIRDSLTCYGALRANELNNQPRDELRNVVTQIKKDVLVQLEQARKTNRNMTGIANELRKLHRMGVNNTANSVTVVASLIATLAFAAIFTLPGGDNANGMAVMADSPLFKVFFFSNSIALFTSLSVVVVQITIVRGELKAERRVVEVINKMMWLAAVCTSLSFISASYIVVSRRNRWAAILITVLGGMTLVGILGAMTFYVVKYKQSRKERKREKYKRGKSFCDSDTDSEVNPMYAI